MLLEKTYSYINSNGDHELTSHKMSPSNLKRANVPDKLIDAYIKITSKMHIMEGYINVENPSPEDENLYQELLDLRAVKNQAYDEIANYLANQEILCFGKIDIAAIKRLIDLIDNGISAYQIEKDTGVSRMTLTNIKNGKADLLKLQLKNAVLLSDYAISKEV